MIQGVHNNNYTNPYQQSVKPTTTASDAPPFLLDYDEKGVIWERSEDKDKEPETKQKSGQSAKEDVANRKGSSQVNLQSSVRNQKTTTNSETDVTTISASLQRIWDGIKAFSKRVFSGIANFVWYGNEEKTEENKVYNEAKIEIKNNTEKLAAEEQENKENALVENQDRDKKIREMIQKKDSDAVMDLLTEHNTKHLAKNSNLLTQYNRRGNIVEPNGSDQAIILSGDKSMKM